MSNESSRSPFTGDFYDEDYFERGKESGKGWLENYRWMPRRTLREAIAIADYLELDEKSYVLDVGCAKGFLVKALRILEIKADGCDISEYALAYAPDGCWNCQDWEKRPSRDYTHVVVKDMLEHLTEDQLSDMLKTLAKVAPSLLCVIPMGDNGTYRIPEYHTEVSHLIAEDETWWKRSFESNGWRVEKSTPHLSGLKENWKTHAGGVGNHVFVLRAANNEKEARV